MLCIVLNMNNIIASNPIKYRFCCCCCCCCLWAMDCDFVYLATGIRSLFARCLCYYGFESLFHSIFSFSMLCIFLLCEIHERYCCCWCFFSTCFVNSSCNQYDFWNLKRKECLIIFFKDALDHNVYEVDEREKKHQVKNEHDKKKVVKTEKKHIFSLKSVIFLLPSTVKNNNNNKNVIFFYCVHAVFFFLFLSKQKTKTMLYFAWFTHSICYT